MRLVDAEALKEEFKSRLALCNEWIANAKDKETKIRASAVKAFIGEVIMTIDNVPAVELATISKEHKGGAEMTADEMLELVETVHKAILPLGYEVITGNEEGDIFNLVLSKLEEGDAE